MVVYPAALERVIEQALNVLRPPPDLLISEWAAEYMYISPEAAADDDVGKWKSIPYQTEIMDAFCDPLISRITWKKSARAWVIRKS